MEKIQLILSKAFISDVIGLIPAAGKATRISPLPCSKELYPIGFRMVKIEEKRIIRTKVISHYLLENMRLANIRKAYFILREGKWDIPMYFGTGKIVDMNIAYLIMDLPFGVPYTLDQAYPFVSESIVALGFPDMLIEPNNAFNELLEKLYETNADIVLGLYKADNPQKTDMVELDDSGKVCSIYIKPENTKLEYSWEIAVWSPVFTNFMHKFLLDKKIGNDQSEVFVGDVFSAAIKEDLHFEYVIFSGVKCIDIGTSDDLIRVLKMSLNRLNDIKLKS